MHESKQEPPDGTKDAGPIHFRENESSDRTQRKSKSKNKNTSHASDNGAADANGHVTKEDVITLTLPQPAASDLANALVVGIGGGFSGKKGCGKPLGGKGGGFYAPGGDSTTGSDR